MKQKRTIKAYDTLITEATAEYLDEAKKTCDVSFTRKFYAPKSVEMSDRSDVSWISTDCKDRTNEVIPEGSFILEDFLKNPIVLWMHDYQTPVALCEWIKPTTGGLKAKTVYPPKPADYEGNWLTDEIWAKVECGLAKGKSIGCFVLEHRKPTDKEMKARPDWEGALILSKLLLNEYSVVPVPANQESLVESISTTPEAHEAVEMALPEPVVIDPVALVEKIIESPLPQTIKALDLHRKTKAEIEAKVWATVAKLDLNKLLDRAIERHLNRFKV